MERGALTVPTASPLSDSTPHSLESVWPRPGKEPLVDVDRAVFVAIHHQAAVLILTAIGSLPQWHHLLVFAQMTHPGRIAFVYYIEFFPKAQTLVLEHLHKAVETPIIIYHAVSSLPLALFLVGLMFLFLDDHLPLGKIANDHSPFSQCASDEMGGFMQTVSLLAPLLLCHPLVDTREMEIAAGLLLAFVPFRANLVKLLVVPAIALLTCRNFNEGLLVRLWIKRVSLCIIVSCLRSESGYYGWLSDGCQRSM
jgi:hypothetical protein